MTAEAVEFDPFSDEYFNDPTEIYARLRDEASVCFSEKWGLYAMSRVADVVSAHRDCLLHTGSSSSPRLSRNLTEFGSTAGTSGREYKAVGSARW